MRGLLKGRPPGTQLLLLICIALASFFLLGLLGTVILSSITGKGFGEIADMANWNVNDPATLTFIRGMQLVQFIALFLIPVLIASTLFSTNTKNYLGLHQPTHAGYWIAGIGVMLLAIPLVNWLGELNRSIPFPRDVADWMKAKEDEAAKTIQALLSRHTIKGLILNLVFIAVLAAAGEELLFRGLVQRLFTRIFKSPFAGVLAAAFLFSAMHLQFYGFFPRFALGIVLGLLYWYSGSLWTAILAHFVYDAALIILAYARPELIADETSVHVGNLVLMGSISLLVVIMIIGWMRNKSKASYPRDYADDSVPVKDHPF